MIWRKQLKTFCSIVLSRLSLFLALGTCLHDKRPCLSAEWHLILNDQFGHCTDNPNLLNNCSFCLWIVSNCYPDCENGLSSLATSNQVIEHWLLSHYSTVTKYDVHHDTIIVVWFLFYSCLFHDWFQKRPREDRKTELLRGIYCVRQLSKDEQKNPILSRYLRIFLPDSVIVIEHYIEIKFCM